jgi:hypothetical protein
MTVRGFRTVHIPLAGATIEREMIIHREWENGGLISVTFELDELLYMYCNLSL